ncbi:MAG: cation transporter [Nitrospira sp.]|nr:cation transporter [Nitrospira sp.]
MGGARGGRRAVGAIGLFVNVGAAWILHSSAEHSINVEGAFQHVMADLLGSVGVVISGSLVWAFGWTLADPIVSVVICILILKST